MMVLTGLEGKIILIFEAQRKKVVPEPVRILCKEVRSYVVDRVWTSG